MVASQSFGKTMSVAPRGGHFIHIKTGRRTMLVRIQDIAEVVPVMTLSNVDHLGGNCRGMLNLRGEMIPIFDVHNDGQTKVELAQLILVARKDDETLGLIVDDVIDVVVIPDEQVAVRKIGGGLEATFARLEDQVIPVLEPTSVL